MLNSCEICKLVSLVVLRVKITIQREEGCSLLLHLSQLFAQKRYLITSLQAFKLQCVIIAEKLIAVQK